MCETLGFLALKDKQRTKRGGFPVSMGLRVHRAISWIGRAENSVGDDDARFVFLWIAFNAAYGGEREEQVVRPGARWVFGNYFTQLVELDEENRIYEALWQVFPGPVRLLMGSKYVYKPFWEFHNGSRQYSNWEEQFKKASRRFNDAFQRCDSATVLSFVFDRLYVLRNQLVHGGSTWNSSVNRSQVRDGADILGFLMPVFVDIMMENPHENWGKPHYPVVD